MKQTMHYHRQRPAAPREIVDGLDPCGLAAPRITLDGDREAHDGSCVPLREQSGTFDGIVENIRAKVVGRTLISVGGNWTRELGRQLLRPARLPQGAGFRRQLVKVGFKQSSAASHQAERVCSR